MQLVGTGKIAATVINPSNSSPAVELVANWLNTRQYPPAETLLRPRSFPEVADLKPAGRAIRA